MIDPLAYAYTTLLRRTLANAGDMDFMGTAALVMVFVPLLPPMEAIGQIGWWLFTGHWPPLEGTMFLGRRVSAVTPHGFAVLALVAFCYYRVRVKLTARFSSFPIPTNRQVGALLVGVIGASILVGYLCSSRPFVGLVIYAALFLSAALLLSRLEQRPG